MATERRRYVNPSSSGGDGTTRALSGANAAYAGLQAAIAGEVASDADLTGEYLRIICFGTEADTAGVTVTGFTNVSAENHVIIQAEVPARWPIDESQYRLFVDALSTYAIILQDDYTVVRGLAIAKTEYKSTNYGITAGGAYNVLDRLVVEGRHSSTVNGLHNLGEQVTVRSCIVANWGSRGVSCNGYAQRNATYLNNLAIGNGGDGFYIRGEATAKNNVAWGNGGADLLYSQAIGSGHSHNVSEDGTAQGALAQKNQTVNPFVGSVPRPKHNSILAGTGLDLTSEGILSLDGEAWVGSWDKGPLKAEKAPHVHGTTVITPSYRDIVKPPQWAWNPNLLAERWKALGGDLSAAVIWNDVGDSVHGNMGSLYPGLVGPTELGDSVNWTADGQYPGQDTKEMTIALHVRIPVAQTGYRTVISFSYWVSASDTEGIGIDANHFDQFAVYDRHNVSNTLVLENMTYPYEATWIIRKDATGIDAFKNGVFHSRREHDGDAWSADSRKNFRVSDRADPNPPLVSHAFMWPYALTDDQIAALFADPFGPIRLCRKPPHRKPPQAGSRVRVLR